MKLKDLFENKEYTFADWAKDEGVDLNRPRDFEFSHTNITSLKGAPTKVHGNFFCNSTQITSLKGAPTSVGGHFDCYNTKITSLQGAPTKVGGDFNCKNTNITSLQGAPNSIGNSFSCGNTNITSLKGAPTSVPGDFFCSGTKITSLQGAPTNVGGDFYCNSTQIDSLQGAPTKVGGYFDCMDTNISSLQNIHHYIHHIGENFYLGKSPIKSNVLGILWIGCDEQGRPRPDGKAPTTIKLDNKQVQDILNRYLEKIHSKEMTPREALIHAQGELQDANLDEYADL